MRLYAKLAAIIFIAVATQWTLKHAQASGADWWFTARCAFAFATENDVMLDRLIEEARAFACCYEPDPVFVSAAGPVD
jgi:hypothetical protein